MTLSPAPCATSSTAQHVDAADGRTADLVDPTTGQVFAEAPVSSAADVDAAMVAAATAFEGWRDSTPSDRQKALIRIADAFEARADELVAAEVENTGKPLRPHPLGGDPADGRPDPVLRRGGPGARGPVRGGVHGRPHVVRPARADRRLRAGDAVELPDDDGGLEVGAGHRRRQHGRAQAVGHHAGLDPADGRDHGRVPAPGRLQRRVRATATPAAPWSSTRSRRWSRSPARCGPAWRSPARAATRPQEGAPRARRQGAGGRLRRRRPRGGGRGDRGRRLLQRRAGLHRRDPGARRRRASTTTSSRRWPSRRRTAPRPGCPTTRTCCSAR